MILVDTTVWIDFFAARPTPQVSALERRISDSQDICTCGMVLVEVLQGIRDDRAYRKTRSYFGHLIYLPMDQNGFVMSAEIYRDLRKRGITIRKPLDCMIASVALLHDVPLLHNDRDFTPIEKHHGLKVVKAKS